MIEDITELENKEDNVNVEKIEDVDEHKPTNLLLIEKSFKTIQAYTLINVDSILFEGSQTYSDILNEISSRNRTYQNIGIFSHGNEVNFEFTHKIEAGDQSFVTFLRQLKTVTGFQNLDLFPCFFGRNFEYVNGIEKALDINIRASTDNTGNRPFGNWIMETDNLNIKDLYFDDSISNFQGVLLWHTQTNRNIMRYVETGKNQVISRNVYLTNDGFVKWLSDVENNVIDFSKNKVNKLYESNYRIIRYHTQEETEIAYVSDEYIYLAIKDSDINDENQEILVWIIRSKKIEILNVSLISKPNIRIVDVCSTGALFALLYSNGDVHTINEDLDYVKNGEVIIIKSNNVDLTNIKYIESFNKESFVALTNEGEVRQWGVISDTLYNVPNQLSKNPSSPVVRLLVNNNGNAVLALCEDGSVVTWGSKNNGGEIPKDIKEKVKGVSKVYPLSEAFVVITKENKVFSWGKGLVKDGKYKTIDLSNESKIEDVYTTHSDYAILLQNKTVVFDGRYGYGDLKNVKIDKIYSSIDAFAALTDNRDIIVRGTGLAGGNLNELDPFYEKDEERIKGPFLKVYSISNTFVAIYKETGKVCVWGKDYTDANSDIKNRLKDLTDIVQVYAVDGTFIFINGNEDELIWDCASKKIKEIEEEMFGITPDIDFTDLQYDEVNNPSILNFYPELRTVDLQPLIPVCLLENTPITLDDGRNIPIQKLQADVHVIDGQKIKSIIKGYYVSKDMVKFSKGCFSPNIPTHDIFITHLHLVRYKSIYCRAYELAMNDYFPTINLYTFPFHPRVCNVLLKNNIHSVNMRVCGIHVETLHPDNPLAQNIEPNKNIRQTYEVTDSVLKTIKV